MSPATRFTLAGGATAAASGAAVLGWTAEHGASSLVWTALGWAASAVPGVAVGAWLARRHGTEGTGFVVAMGTGMLVRLLAVTGTLAAALKAGNGAYRPWLAGFVAGYAPLQLFEFIWFYRRSRRAVVVGR